MPLSMDRWRGKLAVVTGASSGIGAAIAERLVEEGLIVVGLARNVDRVEELAKKLSGKKGKLHAVKADMTKEEDILKAFEWASKNVGPVHILVNNAGIAQATNLTEGDTEKWRKVIDTNVIGLCIATREAVKIMKANNIDGHIIHIGSVLGHIFPNYTAVSIYPVSKHAVRALTETLRQELNQLKLKIKITEVSPGMVDTPFAENSGLAQDKTVAANRSRTKNLESEDVADAVLYVLSTPPHVQVHELMVRPVGQLL